MMQLVRIPKAAAHFGISKQYLWKLIEEKTIKTVTIDGVQYVDLDTTTYKRKHNYSGGGRPKKK